jgi:hypothetical protein
MSDIIYPIGKFKFAGNPEKKQLQQLMANIGQLPADLKSAVSDLSADQLDTAYRSGGWTIRQVVHHLADSHMHAYLRFKWTLTEEKPKIKPYLQDKWAGTADSLLAPPQISLALLEALHQRWLFLMRTMSETDFEKQFEHPESGTWTLNKMIALYDWHGRHHLAQIQGLKEQKSW